jgi:hypothetical protein
LKCSDFLPARADMHLGVFNRSQAEGTLDTVHPAWVGLLLHFRCLWLGSRGQSELFH